MNLIKAAPIESDRLFYECSSKDNFYDQTKQNIYWK